MWLFNPKKETESKPKSLAIPIIQIGKPNSVGNIYTLDSIEDLFEEFKNKNRKVYGTIFSDDDSIDKLKIKGMEDSTHYVDDLVIEDDFLIAITKFTGTPKSKQAYEMLNGGLGMIRPVISGFVDVKTKEITVNELVSFDIMPINEQISNTIEWILIK